MDIDTLINAVIEREGDYGNHPADRGGPTRFGITESVARAQGYAGDIRALPRAEATAIYRRLYWLRPGYDRLATQMPAIAAELFDCGVNMGPATATGFLQRALNAIGGDTSPGLAIDGALGPATFAAIDAFRTRRGAAGEAVLLKAVRALRAERYIALTESRPADRAFAYGWIANRIG